MVSHFILILFILALHLSICDSFAQWMVLDYCSTPLQVGEIIMSQPVVDSTAKLIHLFTVDGLPLPSDYKFTPGEKIRIDIRPKTGQIVYETSSNAKFIDGGCGGIRYVSTISTKPAILQLPEGDVVDPVIIWGAWALGPETVKLTPVITLTPIIPETPKDVDNDIHIADSESMQHPSGNHDEN